MEKSHHSLHHPICGICQKHCITLESVREHLKDGNCKIDFSTRGCNLCLQVFADTTTLAEHKNECRSHSPPNFPAALSSSHPRMKAVAIDCQKVGVGDNRSIDQCASVCLVDEDYNVILFTYILSKLPVTNYRHEETGLTEEDLKNGKPLHEVRMKVIEILCGKQKGWVGRLRLVGHDLRHDMFRLGFQHPRHLLRDTATYRPLMKTNLVSHSLKYLASSYLGYNIRSGKDKPLDNFSSTMRLYKRMQDQDHGKAKGKGLTSWTPRDLEKMTPDKLYHNSESNYHCWCRDQRNSP